MRKAKPRKLQCLVEVASGTDGMTQRDFSVFIRDALAASPLIQAGGGAKPKVKQYNRVEGWETRKLRAAVEGRP